MADLEQLVLSISADTRQMQRALKRLEDQTKQSTDTIAGGFGKLDKSIASSSSAVAGFTKSLIAATAGALTFDRAIQFAVNTIEKFSQIAEISERLGVTTDVFQALQFALSQNGASAEDAEKALTRMSDALGDAARGQGELFKWLQKNNIALTDSNGQLRSAGDMLGVVAGLMAGLGTQQEKLNFAVDIFGRRAGPAMVVTLQEIADRGLPAVVAGAKEAGVIVEKELLDKAKQVSDDMAKLALQAQVFFGSFIVQEIKKAQADLAAFLADIKAAIEFLKSINRTLGRGTPRESGAQSVDESGFLGFTPPRTATRTPQGGDEAAANRAARTAEQEAKRRQKVIDDLKHEAEQLGRTNREQFIYNELKSAGVTATSAQGQEIMRLAGNLYDLRQAQELANKTMKEFQDIAKDSLVGFINDIRHGTDAAEALSKMLDRVIGRLIEMAVQSALFGAGTGGIGGIFGALFGRAGGGPVQPGHLYRVGEQGPEMFVPNVAGRIMPSNEIERRGNQAIELNYAPIIDARGADEAAVKRLERIIAEDRRQFSSKVVAAVSEARRRSVRV